jgi:hypothetical protein
MDPWQLVAVAIIVVGVLWLDRRMRRSGLVEPGSGEAWTAFRLARMVVQVALGIAVLTIVVLVLQALRIQIGMWGFAP